MRIDLECLNEYILSLIPEDRYRETFLGIREYLTRGGKRFRPLILLLTYGNFRGYYHDILYHAAIVELFHNFTLIHDDIEDGSELRRGKPTLHKQYGIPLALNAGDALYTLIFQMVARLDDRKLRELYVSNFFEVVEGQAMDIYWRETKYFPTEEEYMKMISKKTGALIGLSMYLGAYLAGVDDMRYMELGRDIGIAFQIQDDLLNLLSPPEYGKKWADDITEGKRTMMIIHALRRLDRDAAERLREILNSGSDSEDVKREAIDLIKRGKGIQYAREFLKKKFQKIHKDIQELFTTRNHYGEELVEMIRSMEARKR